MPAKGSSLEGWLDYISSVHPREIELGLDRSRAVADRLGLLEPAPRVITVAGTNGKGSCIATMEAVLQQAGIKSGSYTSPHIHCFNERIRIAGSNVSDEQIVTALEAIDSAREGESLSYFEFATLAGLYLLKDAQVEVALLEVGLGGRLDAVNIVDAHVVVISSISIDHTDWLGDNIESIAAEKAGVMRQGSPVVFAGEKPPVAISHRAAAIGAPLLIAARDFEGSESADGSSWCFEGKDHAGNPLSWVELPMPTLLLSNVVASIQALLLLPLSLDRDGLMVALQKLRLMGRFDTRSDLSSGRAIIHDVAHNPAAMELLALRVNGYRARKSGATRVAVVLAMMADKDVKGMLTALETCVDIWYIAQVDQARSMAADEVAQAMNSVGIVSDSQQIKQFDSVESAYEAACVETESEDIILVTGSFFTVAAVHALSERA